TIVKSGIGVVQFHNGSSIKDFSGQINVTQGTLATNGSDWNISAGLMSMDISSGASFDIRTGGIVINNLTGLGTIGSSHNGAVTLSVGNNHGSSTFGGVIRNGGGPPGGISTGVPSLTKNGTGTFTLTGANTYTGTTTVAAGTLQLANANAIQNSALVVNTGGATATLNLRADTDTTFAAASVAFNAWTANTIVNVDQATAGNSNHILGFAATSLTQNSGTFTVNGGNGYSLSLGNLTNGNGGNSNPTIIANANVLINTYTDAGNRNLVLNGTATGSTLGAFTATGAGSASLLSKQGTGTWTLTGTNTYTGSTTVTAGTLRVNGSTHASSAVSVASGATLGGAGTIGGVVNVSGVLAPGASIESLVTGSVTLNDLSTLAVEIQDATTVGADLLAINGNLTLDGTVTLDLAKLGAAIWTAGDKLTLASYTGTWDGGLFTYNSNELSDGEQFSFDGTNWVLDYNDTIEGGNFTTDSTGTYLTMTVVPEPAAALLGSLGLLALLRRRR
ncbi:MAG TPA: autotransporter-associated beta strand repeat-containing protein, partial [Luteolibacter sp.]